VARDFRTAVATAGAYQDIFGRRTSSSRSWTTGWLPSSGAPRPAGHRREIGAPLLATNDCHYTRREEAESHDVLLCIQTGAQMADEKRFRFHGEATG